MEREDGVCCLRQAMNSAASDRPMTFETTSDSDASQKQARSATATTTDTPAFGWSSYAERVNGRFAMIGFVAVVLVELLSGDTFLSWAGLLP